MSDTTQYDKSGIFPDIPFNTYREIKRINASYLYKLGKCPANALVPDEDTPQKLLGRAAHAYILEDEDAFWKEYAVAPKVDRRTKDGKAAWAEFEGKHPGKGIITEGDYENIRGMALSVWRHPFASKVLREGLSEQTILWTDQETGTKCKARVDRIPAGSKGVVADLKTARDASEHAFLRSIVNLGYAMRAAFYCDGISAVSSKMFDAFVFVAVEQSKPYQCGVYTIDNEFLLWGQDEYRRLLKLEKQCREAGAYPAYVHAGCVELYKPAYLQTY